VTDELVKKSCSGVRLAALDVKSLAAVSEVLVALLAFERQRNLNFGSLLEALDKRDATEGGSEVNVEFDAFGAVGVIPNGRRETCDCFLMRCFDAHLILYPPVMALTIPEIMSSVRAMRSL
jgi:hypothetical protein